MGSNPSEVPVSWDSELNAVRLKWHSEWDEGSGVRDAVLAAIDYVEKHDVKNWLADSSTSMRGLTSADLDWVNGEEFRDLIRGSGLRRFVLMPPLPETGQDTGWLSDWEANTLRAFGNGVKAKLSDSISEIRGFFCRLNKKDE